MNLDHPIEVLKQEVKKLCEHSDLMNCNGLNVLDVSQMIHDTSVAIEILRGKYDIDEFQENCKHRFKVVESEVVKCYDCGLIKVKYNDTE